MRTRTAGVVLVAILFGELVILYPGVFARGEVVSSAALAYGMAPWKGHMPGTARPLRGNPVLADDLSLFTPWDAATRAAFAAGSAPLWNPGSGCGMPLLANDQAAALAPTQILRFVWNSPRARTVGVLLKVLVAGLGAFLLLVRWGISPPAAVIGGLAWANSAGVTVWLLYPLAETAAWLPWMLLGLSQLLGVGGAARRTGFVMTAFGGAALLLAGHLPTAAQLLAAAGVGVATLAVLRPDVRRKLPSAAAALLVACLLAAPQLLPTSAYLMRSHARQTRGSGVPSAAQHLPAKAAWSWLVPRGFGSPERDGYRGAMNFNEATASVGITPLFLALLLPFLGLDRRGKALAMTVAVAAALAYGLPPLPWLAGRIPLLKWAAGQRWLVLAQLGVAALAALAAARLGRTSRRRLLLAAAGVAAILLVLVTLHPTLTAGGEGQPSTLAARAVLASACEVMAAAAAVAVAAIGPPAVGLALLALVTATSGLTLAWGFNPTIPVAALPGPTEETRTLDALREGGRILPVGWVMRPNTGLLADLPTVTGVDDLVPERTSAFARWAELSAIDATRSIEPGSAALLRRAAATVVVADRRLTGSGLVDLPAFQGPTLWAAKLVGAQPLLAWYPSALPVSDAERAFAMLTAARLVDENTVLIEAPEGPLPSSPGLAQPLVAERPAPGLVRVATAQPRAGVLVLRELADPGWRVTVDGARARTATADGMFLAVLLGPGAHRVVFEYRPFEWRLGLALFVLGVACVGAAVTAGRRRGRRAPAVVSSAHAVSPQGRTGR